MVWLQWWRLTKDDDNEDNDSGNDGSNDMDRFEDINKLDSISEKEK